MKPYRIIEKYYDKDSELYRILIAHSEQVQKKALKIIKKHPELNADKAFVADAALLHDIGIFKCKAPRIHCVGKKPYICHGYLGAKLLHKEGYPRHALVCERHTGAGLSKEMIIKRDLPIPHRDMCPVSIEEQIICYADKFYSKSKLKEKHSFEHICSKMKRYGEEQLQQFLTWHEMFS